MKNPQPQVKVQNFKQHTDWPKKDGRFVRHYVEFDVPPGFELEPGYLRLTGHTVLCYRTPVKKARASL